MCHEMKTIEKEEIVRDRENRGEREIANTKNEAHRKFNKEFNEQIPKICTILCYAFESFSFFACAFVFN